MHPRPLQAEDNTYFIKGELRPETGENIYPDLNKLLTGISGIHTELSFAKPFSHTSPLMGPSLGCNLLSLRMQVKCLLETWPERRSPVPWEREGN